ncbi:MAG TPA: hypothetical protein VFA68_08925 [Terriglobales bacterium]|nr:hypothetical protein [Terriglobales bacterium]
MRRGWIQLGLIFLAPLACLSAASAQQLRAPAQVTAGKDFSVSTNGSGDGSFYLIGPAHAAKREIKLGGEVQVRGEEIEKAGRYTVIACAGSQCDSATIHVQPDAASRLSLLVHPSRVRVATPNAISAVAFVFDKYHNLVFTQQPVNFEVTSTAGSTITASRPSSDGVAWVRLTSASKEGPAKIAASVGKTTEVRIVRQVASDACNLRIKAQPNGKRIVVETDPVRDCSGNAVPDGTVVSFTQVGPNGKTTVDAPVKKGVARVELPAAGPSRITVASGVVTGNELSVGGRP